MNIDLEQLKIKDVKANIGKLVKIADEIDLIESGTNSNQESLSDLRE